MKNDVIIGKMLGYIEKVLKYTQGMDYDTFIKQEVIKEACIFNLSQLGELAGKIDNEFRVIHSEIPWSQIYEYTRGQSCIVINDSGRSR